ncbi:HNH homing endonuclease [Escherichia phage UAB_Phi78]|uniref:HNH homing endonuclease n=1 Tax=Escherichia phage UAB_Phi78 TaxID=979726 RepID=A0A9K0LKK4_9CAUD|nr:HNH endonuclease [Escherichia phage UAB_Phi78]ADW95244.1 HNH homing endonuclease [Escherichia phage UAB_Phi78]
MELWLPVKGYEGRYSVSNRGVVVSHLTGKPLTQSCNTFGYKQVSLHKDGKQVSKTVHRLVAEVFIPNHNSLPFVNHKDEDKTNNDVSNLEWCTCQYNT